MAIQIQFARFSVSINVYTVSTKLEMNHNNLNHISNIVCWLLPKVITRMVINVRLVISH